MRTSSANPSSTKLQVAVILPSPAPAAWAVAPITWLLKNPEVEVQGILVPRESSNRSPGFLYRWYSLFDSLRLGGGERRNGVHSWNGSIPVVPVEAGPDAMSAALKKLRPDLLLNLGLRGSLPQLASLTKLGVWEFRSGGVALHSNPYLGFWEIYDNEPVTKVSLTAVGPSGDERIIAESGLRTHRNSPSINRAQALRCTPILLRYGMSWLRQQSKRNEPPPSPKGNGHLRSPGAPQLVLFGLKSCASIVKGRTTTRGRKLQWSIGIASADPAELGSSDLARARWLAPDAARFFADPFPIWHQGQ